MPTKHISQIEDCDLNPNAVSNEVLPRKEVHETEETLTALSEEEVGAIRGGLKIKRSDLLELPREDKINY